MKQLSSSSALRRVRNSQLYTLFTPRTLVSFQFDRLASQNQAKGARNFGKKKQLVETTFDEEADAIVKYKPAITPKDDIPIRYFVDPSTGEEVLEELDEDDLDDDFYQQNPAKVKDPNVIAAKRILSHSRVKYRQLEHLPDWLKDRQREISQNRSLQQIRRCLKSWMIKHEIEFMQKFLNRPFHYLKDTASEKFSSSSKIRYVYGPEETIAYAYYHMPSRFTVIKRILNELKLYSNNQFVPSRILDFGCGPATAAAAIREVWPEEAKGMHYAGVEVSQSMTDAARIMTADLFAGTAFWSKSAEVIQRALDRGERYELIICAFTLTELQNDETRRVAVQLLYELLEPNGFILFLESGNPYGSHTVRTAREFLLHLGRTVDRRGRFQQYQDTSSLPPSSSSDRGSNKKEDEDSDDEDFEVTDADEDDPATMRELTEKLRRRKQQRTKRALEALKLEHTPRKLRPQPGPVALNMILPVAKGFQFTDFATRVVSPCAHDKPCPLSKDVWCSFAQKVASGVIRKDAEEKFSFVLLQKSLTADFLTSPRNKQQLAAMPWLAPAQTQAQAQSQTSGSPLDKLSPHAPGFAQQELMLAASPQQILAKLTALTADEDRKREELAARAARKRDRRLIYRPGATEEKFRTLSLARFVETFEETRWDDYSPAVRRDDFMRLIRSPIKAKGHVIFDGCTPSGEIYRHTMTRSDFAALPALYRVGRKAAWGGLLPAYFPLDERLIRSQGRKIAQEDQDSDLDEDEDEDEEEDGRAVDKRRAGGQAQQRKKISPDSDDEEEEAEDEEDDDEEDDEDDEDEDEEEEMDFSREIRPVPLKPAPARPRRLEGTRTTKRTAPSPEPPAQVSSAKMKPTTPTPAAATSSSLTSSARTTTKAEETREKGERREKKKIGKGEDWQMGEDDGLDDDNLPPDGALDLEEEARFGRQLIEETRQPPSDRPARAKPRFNFARAKKRPADDE